mmetsp:Transcript_146958/g.208366  ORF Transcript_146958/g.208366 Transcript_146958/m.208366 type:complete len:166 (-) Transcript_146958:133-630(-)
MVSSMNTRYKSSTVAYKDNQSFPQSPEEEEREIMKIARILVELNARKKRKRHQTTPQQLRLLESIFAVNRTPDLALRTKLSGQLDMTPRRIQIWFQNKRAKMKKLKKMREEEEGATPDSTPASSPVGSPISHPTQDVSPPSSPRANSAPLCPLPPIQVPRWFSGS